MRKLTKFAKPVIIILIVLALLYIYTRTFVYKTTYMEYIVQNTPGSSVDPYLILSIIKVESGFNPNAISSKEAKGLMQIRETTYPDVANVTLLDNDSVDLYDPETNIKIGIAYFKKLVRMYDGNYYIALLAYNGGMGNVNKWLNDGIISRDLDYHIEPDIPFRETRNYLNKVITTYNVYKFLYR